MRRVGADVLDRSTIPQMNLKRDGVLEDLRG